MCDPPPRNHSSDTKHGSRPIARRSFFESFPDELIIYTLSFPPLPDVVRFASTSRRHRSIASAEQIWFPVALNIIKDNVSSNNISVDEGFMRGNRDRFLAALGLSAKETTQAWFGIATRLVEQVEWKLGWWLATDSGSAKGRLWRIFIELDEAEPGGFFRVKATQVKVLEKKEYTLLLQPGRPLEIVRIVPGISTLRSFGGRPQSSAAVDGFRPLSSTLVERGTVFGYLSLGGDRQVSLNYDSPSYVARKLQDHHLGFPLGADSWKIIARRRWHNPFSDAPYPPPLLSQLLSQRGGRAAHDGPVIPSIALSPIGDPETLMETLLSVHRPSSFPKVANELVQTGIYVAPYLSHGWEYLLVRIRELTEDDFQNTWPWEGSMAVAPSDAIQHIEEPNWESAHSHLGPFAGTIPTNPISSDPLRVSRDHVRRGSRVLEAIKITGDPNVPGGQRSFIAFLNDPLVRHEALQEAEETFPDVSPEREDELPWPFVPHPPTTTDEVMDKAAHTQPFFSPERGIDIPGVARVAAFGFSLPQWVNCVVHVECKTRFTVAIFSANARVFRKLNDWGVETQ